MRAFFAQLLLRIRVLTRLPCLADNTALWCRKMISCPRRNHAMTSTPTVPGASVTARYFPLVLLLIFIFLNKGTTLVALLLPPPPPTHTHTILLIGIMWSTSFSSQFLLHMSGRISHSSGFVTWIGHGVAGAVEGAGVVKQCRKKCPHERRKSLARYKHISTHHFLAQRSRFHV